MKEMIKEDELLGHCPAFKTDLFEYEEYKYWDYHQPHGHYNERQKVEGIHINPLLPEAFDNYPNEERPAQELTDWWELPYITVTPVVYQNKLKIVYNVRCLDGGAWDRSTSKGDFDNLEAALERAKEIKGVSIYDQHGEAGKRLQEAMEKANGK